MLTINLVSTKVLHKPQGIATSILISADWQDSTTVLIPA